MDFNIPKPALVGSASSQSNSSIENMIRFVGEHFYAIYEALERIAFDSHGYFVPSFRFDARNRLKDRAT